MASAFASTSVRFCWTAMLKSYVPSLLGTRVRANRSLNDVSTSISIVKTAAAAWDWIQGLSSAELSQNVVDVLKPFAHRSSQNHSTIRTDVEANVKDNFPGI